MRRPSGSGEGGRQTGPACPGARAVRSTGIGDVILFNQSLARRAGLVVVEGEGAVVVPSFLNPHARANGTCTFTGGGFSIDTIEPFDEPATLDVLIVP
jgi:hypothetical protein